MSRSSCQYKGYRHTSISALFAFIAFILVSAPADANELLPKSSTTFYIGGVGEFFDSDFGSYADQYSYSIANTGLSPVTYVSAEISIKYFSADPDIFDYRDGMQGDFVRSMLQYSFVINAPNISAANDFDSMRPDVFADGSYSISHDDPFEERGINGYVAFQDILDINNPTGFNIDCSIVDECLSSEGAFRHAVNFYRLNDLQFAGRLNLEAEVGSGSFGTNSLKSAYAYIDPVISIDPAFTEQNPGFTITQIVLPDANGTVPEPASWAMMIAGFGLVGAALRRRRIGIAAI